MQRAPPPTANPVGKQPSCFSIHCEAKGAAAAMCGVWGRGGRRRRSWLRGSTGLAHPNCDQSSAGEQREDKMDAKEEGGKIRCMI